MYERRINSAIDAAQAGSTRRARYSVYLTLWVTRWLDRSGHLDSTDADVISAYLRNAVYALADER